MIYIYHSTPILVLILCLCLYVLLVGALEVGFSGLTLENLRRIVGVGLYTGNIIYKEKPHAFVDDCSRVGACDCCSSLNVVYYLVLF